MKNQWAHDEQSAGTRRARCLWARLDRLFNVLGGENGIVCCGDHAQRAILPSAGIEVKTQREHLAQNFQWWLDVHNTRLGRPWAEAGQIEPLADGN